MDIYHKKADDVNLVIQSMLYSNFFFPPNIVQHQKLKGKGMEIEGKTKIIIQETGAKKYMHVCIIFFSVSKTNKVDSWPRYSGFQGVFLLVCVYYSFAQA